MDHSSPTKERRRKMTVLAQKARRVEGQTLLEETKEIHYSSSRKPRPSYEEQAQHSTHELLLLMSNGQRQRCCGSV